MKKHVWQMSKSSPYLQRSLILDKGHSLIQVPKRSGILWKRIVHKELGIISQKRYCRNSQKADVFFPCNNSIVQGNLRSKGYILLRITINRDFFRIIVFANQLSLYGAVENMCEEFESHQDRSGQPDVRKSKTKKERTC